MFTNLFDGADWLIVLVIILVLFGPKNLPKLAQSLGLSIRELKKGLHGLGEEEPPAHTEPAKPQSYSTNGGALSSPPETSNAQPVTPPVEKKD